MKSYSRSQRNLIGQSTNGSSIGTSSELLRSQQNSRSTYEEPIQQPATAAGGVPDLSLLYTKFSTTNLTEKHQRMLNTLFVLLALFQFAMGIAIWFSTEVAILWVTLWLLSIGMTIFDSILFTKRCIRKAKHITASDLRPARGRRAPPSSMRSLSVLDQTPIPDPEVADDPVIANEPDEVSLEMRTYHVARTSTFPGARQPTRKSTFRSENLPARTLTFDESSVGL
jgi:hypothetical protein